MILRARVSVCVRRLLERIPPQFFWCISSLFNMLFWCALIGAVLLSSFRWFVAMPHCGPSGRAYQLRRITPALIHDGDRMVVDLHALHHLRHYEVTDGVSGAVLLRMRTDTTHMLHITSAGAAEGGAFPPAVDVTLRLDSCDPSTMPLDQRNALAPYAS